VNFFEPVIEAKGAAEFLTLNNDILVDSARISAGRDPNRPGDNRVAVEIAELQYGKPLFGGTLTLDEFYNGMVGELGIRTQAANRQAKCKTIS
jgi:flagellar hook-associated protein FlgK